MPVDALAEDAPEYQKPMAEPARIKAFSKLENFVPETKEASDVLIKLLQQPQIGSKICF